MMKYQRQILQGQIGRDPFWGVKHRETQQGQGRGELQRDRSPEESPGEGKNLLLPGGNAQSSKERKTPLWAGKKVNGNLRCFDIFSKYTHYNR